MTAQPPPGDREKIVSKLPADLRQKLKIRTAQRGNDIQDAVSEGIAAWRALASNPATHDTSGAGPFSTWLPEGQWDGLRQDAKDRGVSAVQALTQAVALWLEKSPAPGTVKPAVTRRIIVANQKGGVGKSTVAGGLGAALAEDPDQLHPYRLTAQQVEKTEAIVLEMLGCGLNVLLVDFDAQGHLTTNFGFEQTPIGGDSLTEHMGGTPKGELKELIRVVEEPRFGGRLHLLPSCQDAFLLDIRLSPVRAREAALERALAAVEADYDAVVIDCPPSLGLSMDAAVYYGRRREGEEPGSSGIAIVVQAEDSSVGAYRLLTSQIEDLRSDLAIEADYLGIIVNLYDARKGFIATSSLEGWRAIGDPRVVAVIPDLKEQREAVRMNRPLLAYSPNLDQSQAFRGLAKELT